MKYFYSIIFNYTDLIEGYLEFEELTIVNDREFAPNEIINMCKEVNMDDLYLPNEYVNEIRHHLYYHHGFKLYNYHQYKDAKFKFDLSINLDDFKI
jgi:hypothetical protein